MRPGPTPNGLPRAWPFTPPTASSRNQEYARTHYIDRRQQEVDDYVLNCYVRHLKYPEILPEGECPRISNAPAGV